MIKQNWIPKKNKKIWIKIMATQDILRNKIYGSIYDNLFRKLK